MLLRTLATAMLALLFVLLVAVAAAPVQEEELPGRVRRDACDATGWEWLNEAACATQCRLDDYKESKCLLGKCVCYTLPIAIE